MGTSSGTSNTSRGTEILFDSSPLTNGFIVYLAKLKRSADSERAGGPVGRASR